MTGKALLALTSLAAIAAPLAAAEPARDYDVRLTVRDGDKAPTTPRLIVRAGEPATFMIANGRYSLRVVATPGPDGRVSLASNVSTWHPDGLRNDASTITIAADGVSNVLLMPHADPAAGAGRDLRVDVSVRPVE